MAAAAELQGKYQKLAQEYSKVPAHGRRHPRPATVQEPIRALPSSELSPRGGGSLPPAFTPPPPG